MILGVIGPTKATVSPWTPLPAADPNRGGLPPSQQQNTKQLTALIYIPAANETMDRSGNPFGFFHPLFILLSQLVSFILRQYDSQALVRKKSALSISLLCSIDNLSDASCTLCLLYVKFTIVCSLCGWRSSSAPPASPEAQDAYKLLFHAM